MHVIRRTWGIAELEKLDIASSLIDTSDGFRINLADGFHYFVRSGLRGVNVHAPIV